MASSSIFIAMLMVNLLATSSRFVLCEGTEGNIDQRKVTADLRVRRVRRMSGYRMKCLPVKKKVCALLRHKGITKRLCFTINIKDCTALDWWHLTTVYFYILLYLFVYIYITHIIVEWKMNFVRETEPVLSGIKELTIVCLCCWEPSTNSIHNGWQLNVNFGGMPS